MSSTDWSDQTESMLNAWTQAQKTLWETWANVALPSTPSPSSSAVFDQWQKFAQQNLNVMLSGSAPIAQTTAEQFLAAQGVALRFLEFSTRALQATAPKFDKGEDWRESMKRAVDQMRQDWLQFPTDLASATRDPAKLWQLYVEQWKSFGQPWEAVWREVPSHLGQAAMGRGEALVDLSSQYRDAYNQTFGRLAGSPNLGLTRELSQKLAQGYDAFVAWHLANLEYQGVLAQVWDRAFEEFGNNIIALAEQNQKIENVRDLILLWTRGAEQVFLDAFRSEKYVMAQSKFLSATMTYRLRQRAIIEVYQKTYGLPTRSELDQAHQRIYELRKQVKMLKKELADHIASEKNGSGGGR